MIRGLGIDLMDVDRIQSALERHPRARPLVVPGEVPTLGERAAHHAVHIVRTGARARQPQVQRVAAMEGIVFAHDAADPHNFLLIDTSAE